jgi:ArsR family transcriptional regulator, virulence genes transcriptional regulator
MRASVTQIRDLESHAVEATRLLRALANARRLAILCELTHGERSVGDLVASVRLQQSALSQHLAKLRAAGIVATRREAQTIYYRFADPAAEAVMASLAAIYCRPARSLKRSRLG